MQRAGALFPETAGFRLRHPAVIALVSLVCSTGCAPHTGKVAKTAIAKAPSTGSAAARWEPSVGATSTATVAAAMDARTVMEAVGNDESRPPVLKLPPMEWSRGWQGFGIAKCSYLAPAHPSDFIADDGSVDVIFHFHAGQMSEREMKASGARAVFVSCGYGIGSGGYSSNFDDPARFGVMIKRLTHTIGAAAKRKDVHINRLALASWSAGFAAVSRILAVEEWYEKVDTVVLLDSLHAQYIDTEPGSGGRAAQGVDHVDVRQLKRFTRFAIDAAQGKKTMVVTHSSIVPPDYASTSEATAALLMEAGVTPTIASPASDEDDTDRLSERWGTTFGHEKERHTTMRLAVRADEGGLHVRGFRGIGPHDHFDHLHLIGEALGSWLVPRWYTPAGERR